MKYVFTLLLFCFSFQFLFAQGKDHLLNQPGYIKGELIYSLDNRPTPQCHASTIASSPDGLVAAWFGGTEEKNPDVGIWVSRSVNGAWTKPVEVANGIQPDGKRFPCWNPVLFYTDMHTLKLYYKVGPDPINWWGLEITSTDNGVTWSNPKRLPENIFGPIKNKPVRLSTGEIVSPSSTENDGWKVHTEISADNGNTWKHIDVKTEKDFFVIQPTILLHEKDKIQILCRSKNGFITQTWSSDKGNTWSKMTAIDLPNPNSGIDAVTMKDGRQLMVYNNTGMIEGKWGGKRSPINIAISGDGIKWKNVLTLEDQEGEFSYPAVIQSDDGLIHVTYTYQRESIKHVVIDPKKLN